MLFGSAGVVGSLVDGSGRAAHACARAWAHTVLYVCGIRLRVEGRERLRSGACYVFVANHCSALDIPALLAALPGPTRMLAKASLFRLPFLGWYIRRVGYVPVDRTSPRRAARSLGVALARAGSGRSMVVFAEGTRSAGGATRPFKRGAFWLAARTGLPLVPVALVNSGRLLPPGARWPDPGLLEVRVGEPLGVSDDAAVLAAQAHERIAALLRPRA